MGTTRENSVQLFVYVVLSLICFAGNSVLCRLALREPDIDPGSFTLLRVISATVALTFLQWIFRGWRAPKGDKPDLDGGPHRAVDRLQETKGALGASSPLERTGSRELNREGEAGTSLTNTLMSSFAIAGYALAFSFAYVSLSAASGALILFGAVQTTMIGYGFLSGERWRAGQWLGAALAIAGVAYLLLPGAQAPEISGAVMMIVAGIAWGYYSILGRRAKDAIRQTQLNFAISIPFVILGICVWIVSAWMLGADFSIKVTTEGALFSILSGAITSGVGYVFWYLALPKLPSTLAATLQLAVPVIASLGGVILLGELMTWRLGISAGLILGGIFLVIGLKQAK